MKKYHTNPKTGIYGKPFIEGFTDIETENHSLVIGSSGKEEDVFASSFPEYIRLCCAIETKSEFPDVVISARYKVQEDSETKTMSYRIYDRALNPMDKVVSEISLNFSDFSDGFSNSVWKKELLENPVIYRKNFQTQLSSRNIDNFRDPNMPQSGLIHTKSRAHPFGGYYYPGIKLSDIQPCLFYVGTGLQAKEYITLISAKNVIQGDEVRLSPEIPIDSLATLEDDIYSGKIEISFQNQKYKSILATKDTFVSSFIQILFRKEL